MNIENYYKKCTKCCEIKQKNEFHSYTDKRRNNKKYLHSSCKKCELIYKRKRYAENPRRYIEQHNKWREQNLEKCKLIEKRWRENNKEKHRANSKAWAQANAEKVAKNKRKNVEENPERYEEYHKNYNIIHKEIKKEYNKNYYKNNKEKFFLSNARRRSIKTDQMHVDHDLSIEKNYYIMASKLFEDTGVVYHVDHIWPLSKGGPHHHDNLQIITKDINMQKNNSLLFKHPDIKTWCDLPDHIIKWIKENKREKFESVVKQIIKRKKHTQEEIEKLNIYNE